MSLNSGNAQGLVVPHFETLAMFHPGFALAIASGVPCRPDVRVLSQQFDSSAQVGNALPASFSEIMGAYSVFVGCDVTIDPTNAFPGNPVKYLNDALQAQVTGITFKFTTRGSDDYTPIPDETPLQAVPRLLAAAAGIWSLDNPDNVKATFTMQSVPNGSPTPGFPFTVWINFAFLRLAPEGTKYLCCPAPEARKRLCDLGCLPRPAL